MIAARTLPARRLAAATLAAGLAIAAATGAARAVIILETTWQQEGGSAADEPEGFRAHVALAHQAPFKPLIAMSGDDGQSWTGCSGTWLGNFGGVGYVLTAAHCFDPGDSGDAFLYRSEGETVHEGTLVWRHPRYNGDNERRGGYDAALVRLDGPVTDGGAPPLLWTGDIAVGQRLVFVGFGNRGLATTGERSAFDEPTDNKTAAENVVAALGAPARAGTDDDLGNWMSVTLRRPSEGAGRLDGLIGTGDSGGSAWMQRDGRWYLVGVGVSGTGTAYGDESFFLRLAGIRPWLSALLPGLRFSP